MNVQLCEIDMSPLTRTIVARKHNLSNFSNNFLMASSHIISLILWNLIEIFMQSVYVHKYHMETVANIFMSSMNNASETNVFVSQSHCFIVIVEKYRPRAGGRKMVIDIG